MVDRVGPSRSGASIMPCYDGQSCSSYYSHGHGGTSTFNRHSLQGWELADVWQWRIWSRDMIHDTQSDSCIIIAGSCRLVARVMCINLSLVVCCSCRLRCSWPSGRARAMGLYGSGTILPELVRSVLILESWQQVRDGSCGNRVIL